jgi:CheY-like chemotaxis protein
MEKILIVEDDRAVQRALKHLLVSEDYSVETASDGAGDSRPEASRDARP